MSSKVMINLPRCVRNRGDCAKGANTCAAKTLRFVMVYNGFFVYHVFLKKVISRISKDTKVIQCQPKQIISRISKYAEVIQCQPNITLAFKQKKVIVNPGFCLKTQNT